MSFFEKKLFLAATPIGNYGDVSERLKFTLENVDIIAAEDTRRIQNLLHVLDIKFQGKILSFFDHNEEKRANELIDYLCEGKSVLVVSDAGMPLVNDPGFKLVTKAIKNDIQFTCLPGPSAVLTALVMSGLPSERFSFEGFVPRKTTEKETFFKDLYFEKRTMVFFETTHRILDTLKVLADNFEASRRVVICRELTKTYEEIIRSDVGSILEVVGDRELKGEIVLVLEGSVSSNWTMDKALSLVQEMLNEGKKLKEASKIVAKTSGFSANDLYKNFLNN